MPKPLRNLINDRMFQLQDLAIKKGLVNSSQEWFKAIGSLYPNRSKYLDYTTGFTDEQKLAAAKMVGANLNWIFGLEANMIRKEPKDPLEMIKAAVKMMESKKK